MPSHALTPPTPVLKSDDVSRIVDRMAHQILEKTSGATDVVLLGIPTRGVPLARRLVDRIGVFEAIDVPLGALDQADEERGLGRIDARDRLAEIALRRRLDAVQRHASSCCS